MKISFTTGWGRDDTLPKYAEVSGVGEAISIVTGRVQFEDEWGEVWVDGLLIYRRAAKVSDGFVEIEERFFGERSEGANAYLTYTGR